MGTWTGVGTSSDKILLRNNTGDGTFTRITEGELVTDFGHTRETQWADYDNDGDQDVIVLNQATSASVQRQTRLYKNNGDGTFTRVLGSVFESSIESDRSCSWGDYDNDGNLDIFITATNTNRLYRNLGDGTFTQVTGSVVEEDYTVTEGTFGSGWGDIDNDGDLDLFAMGINSILYYNNGNGTFTKYATQELFNAPSLTKLYGPALEDVDNDGFLDFHNGGFSNPDIANFIYRNTTPASASRKYIKINLKGSITNRSAIGARITLVAGGKTQIREVQSHTAQSTQSSPTQHFGLGSASVVTSIVVNWPSGLTKTLTAVSVNQTITIVEDDTSSRNYFYSPCDTG
ncbi:MAG: CRTAC1 family protein [Cytophagales bacterium]|nr:CRTAC1 family protein [Cytophagales bacterium]